MDSLCQDLVLSSIAQQTQLQKLKIQQQQALLLLIPHSNNNRKPFAHTGNGQKLTIITKWKWKTEKKSQ